MTRPMLGDLELEQVQFVQADEEQVLTRHQVPGLEGDFLQVTGRAGARIDLAGVLTAADPVTSLGTLRERFRAGDPVPFVSDITTATETGQVLIERMDVREIAGRPDTFEYLFGLREVVAAKPAGTQDVVIPPPSPPDVENGRIAVTVVVEGDPNFDLDRVRVTVHGTQASGEDLTRVLTDKASPDTWTADPFPPGTYTADALVDDNRTPNGEREVLTGSAALAVRPGETATATIVLHRGAKLGTVFVIHFHFDKAFVEPCMRHVLKQVADRAAASGERLLVVGHTDKVGSDAYNQGLSERRARATYAMLTFGHAPQASIAEWNELRKARSAGELVSVKDTWGTREIQHMLQDLGRFTGNVGKDPELTDAAVRAFQRDHGLAEDGVVGDQTWPVLIEAYLGNGALDVAADRFLPNANASGCDGGPLRWLGCNEQDPVKNTPDAWRPNRRTELMFVHESAVPCQVPQPVTLAQVPEGAGGGGWCLNDGTATAVNCFVVPYRTPCPPSGTAWCRQPAEPGSFTVRGTVRFEDGTPFAGGAYTLTAPDGEYLAEVDGKPVTGEVPKTAGTVPAGTPIPGRTGPHGDVTHPTQKGPGTFVLTVGGPFLAREAGQPLSAATGNAVCFRLDGGMDADIVIVDRSVAAVTPTLSAPPAVVVRKPHTNPARAAVQLGASGPFTGTGRLSRSSDRIRFFDAAVGGTEITFNGVDDVFTADQLGAGRTVFAEGSAASAAAGDVTVTLALTVNGTPGLSTTSAMTSVELTLDVGLSRVAAGADPPLLPVAQKAAPGRAVQLADPGLTHERALAVVRPVVPAGFAGQVTLAALAGGLTIWNEEVPAAGQAPVPLPHAVAAGAIPAAGLRLFVDGSAVSVAATDTGLQLGLDGVEPDADHVRLTVVGVDLARQASAAAPAITAARFGIWDRAYDAIGNVRNGEAEADNFVGQDVRRMHVRVRDAARTDAEAPVRWRTLKVDRTDDDAPPSQLLSVPRSAAGSLLFLSRGVMLAADDTDRDQPTHSGLAAPHPDAGLRDRGQSNHRLRRADIEGFVQVEYDAQPGVRLPVRLPVFPRTADERRRLPVHVIRYTHAADPGYRAASDAYIAEQFAHAVSRWRQVGLLPVPAATVDRAVPAAALVAGRYAGAANNLQEQAVLADLIPTTLDNTLTVVFVDLAPGNNAYTTVGQRNPVPLPDGTTVLIGDRFFVFIATRILSANDETLAHELHHVVFNRFDDAEARQFFTFNTTAPTTDPRNAGIALPDPRVYRRVQNLNSPDPDADVTSSNILNWVRRARTARQPALAGTPAADNTTGNTLVVPF